MTAWLVVSAPMCILAKCCIDFLALEYGSKFQFISDDQLAIICVAMCLYAGFVDIVNFGRRGD